MKKYWKKLRKNIFATFLKNENEFFGKLTFFIEHFHFSKKFQKYFFSTKIFFKMFFLHDKKISEIFLDIYIEVKFHALSIYEVFRAIRARQTHSLEPGKMLVQKIPFFRAKCGLRTLWAPRSVDLLYSTHWFQPC